MARMSDDDLMLTMIVPEWEKGWMLLLRRRMKWVVDRREAQVVVGRSEQKGSLTAKSTFAGVQVLYDSGIGTVHCKPCRVCRILWTSDAGLIQQDN